MTAASQPVNLLATTEVLRTGRFAKNRKNKHKPKDPECEQAEAFKFGLILAADDLGQTKGAVATISIVKRTSDDYT